MSKGRQIRQTVKEAREILQNDLFEVRNRVYKRVQEVIEILNEQRELILVEIHLEGAFRRREKPSACFGIGVYV